LKLILCFYGRKRFLFKVMLFNKPEAHENVSEKRKVS